MGDSRERLTAIEGQPPDLVRAAAGLRLRTRAARWRSTRCRDEAPPEIRVGARSTGALLAGRRARRLPPRRQEA